METTIRIMESIQGKPKPTTERSFFAAVLNEKNVAQNRIDYQVYGVWITDVGNGNFGATLTSLQSFLAGLKNENPTPWKKPTVSADDIIKQNSRTKQSDKIIEVINPKRPVATPDKKVFASPNPNTQIKSNN